LCSLTSLSWSEEPPLPPVETLRSRLQTTYGKPVTPDQVELALRIVQQEDAPLMSQALAMRVLSQTKKQKKKDVRALAKTWEPFTARHVIWSMVSSHNNSAISYVETFVLRGYPSPEMERFLRFYAEFRSYDPQDRPAQNIPELLIQRQTPMNPAKPYRKERRPQYTNDIEWMLSRHHLRLAAQQTLLNQQLVYGSAPVPPLPLDRATLQLLQKLQHSKQGREIPRDERLDLLEELMLPLPILTEQVVEQRKLDLWVSFIQSALLNTYERNEPNKWSERYYQAVHPLLGLNSLTHPLLLTIPDDFLLMGLPADADDLFLAATGERIRALYADYPNDPRLLLAQAQIEKRSGEIEALSLTTERLLQHPALNSTVLNRLLSLWGPLLQEQKHRDLLHRTLSRSDLWHRSSVMFRRLIELDTLMGWKDLFQQHLERMDDLELLHGDIIRKMSELQFLYYQGQWDGIIEELPHFFKYLTTLSDQGHRELMQAVRTDPVLMLTGAVLLSQDPEKSLAELQRGIATLPKDGYLHKVFLRTLTEKKLWDPEQAVLRLPPEIDQTPLMEQIKASRSQEVSAGVYKAVPSISASTQLEKNKNMIVQKPDERKARLAQRQKLLHKQRFLTREEYQHEADLADTYRDSLPKRYEKTLESLKRTSRLIWLSNRFNWEPPVTLRQEAEE